MIIKEETQKIAEKEAVRDGCDFIRYLKTHGELFVFLAGFYKKTVRLARSFVL